MKPKFICDAMLGRLATWLRLCGYDTLYEPEAADNDLLARAEADSRVLLTRDTSLVNRRAVNQGLVRAVLVKNDDWRRQLRQLVSEIGLDLSGGPRCPRCNELLSAVDKPGLRGRVPPYVWRTQEQFHQCPRCARIFWPATHWDKIERIKRGLSGDEADAG